MARPPVGAQAGLSAPAFSATHFLALERIHRRFPYTGAKLFRNLARVQAERLRSTTGAVGGELAPLPSEVGAAPGSA